MLRRRLISASLVYCTKMGGFTDFFKKIGNGIKNAAGSVYDHVRNGSVYDHVRKPAASCLDQPCCISQQYVLFRQSLTHFI